MKDFFARVDWLFVLIIIIGLMLVAMVVSAFAAENQYLRFPNFSAGLTTNQVGEVPPNACLRLENFLFDNQELRVRKGYGNVSGLLSSQSVGFISVYRKQGTGGKLFVQNGNRIYIIGVTDGDSVWSDNEYTGQYFSTGTLGKGDSLAYYVYSSDTTTKWESYQFASIILDSATQTTQTVAVDYAVNDTTLKLVTPLTDWAAGWTYSFSSGLGRIVDASTFVDSFYIATTTGKLKYNDSVVTGTNTPTVYRGIASVYSRKYAYNEGQYHYYTKADSITIINGDAYAATANEFVKISLRSTAASFTPLAGQVIYYSAPIYQSTRVGTNLKSVTFGSGTFYPDSTEKPFITFVNMDIDPSTKLTVYADSIIARRVLSGPSEDKYPYTIIVDDSLFAGKDSTFFMSGDWFVSNGTAILDDVPSKYSPVIGNFNDDSGRVYVADTYLRTGVDTIRTNVPITFYRRKVRTSAEAGVLAAIFWNDRYNVVYDSASSTIYHSEPFFPQTFTAGTYVDVSIDDGEPILWMKEMYGTLLIGKQSSIWKLTGIFGVDDFARLDKAVEGMSFVAPKSIVQRGGLMFGLGRDAFYMYDFNSMVRISEQINDLVRDSINWNYVDNITAAYFDNHFWVSYPSRNSVVNDRTLCYDPQNKAWSTSTLNFSGVYVDVGVNDTDNVYIGDPDAGNVFVYGKSTTDAGTSISASLYSTWFDMGSTFLDKVVNRLAMVHHRESTSSVLVSCVAKREDGLQVSSSRTFTGALSNYRGNKRLWFDTNGLRGMEYQLQLTATSAIGLRIGNVEVEYQVLSAGY